MKITACYLQNYFLLIIILLSGCTARLHIPDTINIDDSGGYAILKVETVGDHGLFDNSKKRLYITHLDGEHLFSFFTRYPETVYLDAGVHKVKVLFRKNFYRSRTCVWLDAIASESYTIRRKAFKKGGRNYMSFWIVSDATGNPVGGICESAPIKSEEQ